MLHPRAQECIHLSLFQFQHTGTVQWEVQWLGGEWMVLEVRQQMQMCMQDAPGYVTRPVSASDHGRFHSHSVTVKLSHHSDLNWCN